MDRVDLIVGEGATEIAISYRLLDLAQIDRSAARPLDKGGQSRFWADMKGYINAARAGNSVFALADLESASCPVTLLREKIIGPRPQSFCLRIAVRMSESWLLADTQGMSQWLRISEARMPSDPDRLQHAKKTLVNLARQSPLKQRRETLVPEANTSGIVGKEYLPALTQFITEVWSPTRASLKSRSLHRALKSLGVE